MTHDVSQQQAKKLSVLFVFCFSLVLKCLLDKVVFPIFLPTGVIPTEIMEWRTFIPPVLCYFTHNLFVKIIALIISMKRSLIFQTLASGDKDFF